MNNKKLSFIEYSKNYIEKLNDTFNDQIFYQIEKLSNDLKKLWSKEKCLFICVIGGSAANAIHMANDFHYGVGACG